MMVRCCTEHEITEGHMKCWGNLQFYIMWLRKGFLKGDI